MLKRMMKKKWFMMVIGVLVGAIAAPILMPMISKIKPLAKVADSLKKKADDKSTPEV